jgi:hypothetical protein
MSVTFARRRGMVRRVSGAGAGLVLAAGLFFVAMPAGQAHADSGTSCGYGDSDGNTQTCLTIGNNSVSVSAGVVNGGAGRVLSSCLHVNGTPDGCTGFSYVGPDAGTGLTVIYGSSVPNGTYCAVTFRQNPDGSSSQIGDNCQGIDTVTVG